MPITRTESARLNYDFGLRDQQVREDGDKLIVSGVASNWDLDREGDVMARTAFDRSLRRYLMTNPIVLFSHRWSMPMGKTLAAEVKPDGLHVVVELPRPEAGTEAMNIWRLVKAGVIRAFSVGGRPTRKVIGGLKTIVDWDLRELSICPAGVNPMALFSLTSQVGKAFEDTDPATARARRELEALRRASDALDRIGIHLELMALRERVHRLS